MSKLVAYIQSFIASREDRERGATMVEYGLMVALIAVVVMVAVGPLGTAIATMFNGITAAI